MGTWGSGNFQDDTALDHFSGIVQPLLEHISKSFKNKVSLEPDEYDGIAVLCNMDILVAIAYGLGSQESPFFISKFPKVNKIAAWQKTYLEVWDDTIDGLDPDEDYKLERREVIVKTFERFIALAKQYQEAS
jgi:Domain of unknown function (DUF4259)